MSEQEVGVGTVAEVTGEQKTDEQLWDKVQADRATQAGDEQPQSAGSGDLAAQKVGLPSETTKLIEQIDKLKTVVEQQGSNLETVSRQMSAVNGTFGTLKQRLDASQVVLDKVAPVIEGAEVARKEEERKKAETAAARRKELRERIIDTDMLDYLDELLPESEKPAAATASRETKPAEEKKPDAGVQAPSVDERVRVLTLQRELSDIVPGWLKIRETPEYKAFIAGPGKAVFESTVETWNPDEAAKIFIAFDKHKSDAAKVAQVEKDRQERLRRGENPEGRKTTTGAVDLSADDAWEKVKRDRKAAQAIG